MLKLHSTTWEETVESIRKMHLGSLNPESVTESDWENAFNMLVASIEDERKANPYFAPELSNLTDETGIAYNFADILEDYFDHLEEINAWDGVIDSCDKILKLFSWHEAMPSEYMYRKGNALQKAGRLEEAEAFGKEWLSKYPDDLYAGASNAFLLLSMGRIDEAEALTEKYMSDDLVCDDKSSTLFMAAYRLYEMTDNINAKKRVEQKMAEYNELMNK